MDRAPRSLSVVCVLPADPERALGSLQALAALADGPEHEVVLVDDATFALDDLLARVDGVEIVRRAERGGLIAALTDGVAAAAGDDVVLLWDGARLDPGALVGFTEALAELGVAAATPPAPDGRPLTAPCALAAPRTPLLAALAGVAATGDDQAPAAVLLALSAHGAVRPAASAVVHPAREPGDGPRSVPGAHPHLSIVVPTLDVTAPRVQASLRALRAHTVVPYELIVVDNGAGPQGFSAPVNAGLRAGRADHLVVMNDDVEVLPGWWEPLHEALDAGAPVVFPLTVDTAMRHDFAAWCFALTRATLEEFSAAPGEFLEPSFRVWFQDTDLLHRLRLADRPPVLVDRSRIRHGLSLTVSSPDPALRAWIDRQIAEDRAAFEARWGAGVAGAAR